MKASFIIISIIIIFSACTPKGIEDKSKRNENWAWWVDAKTGVGQWISISSVTTVDRGKYTMFYSNQNIRVKGKLDKGKPIDTIYEYDLNGQLDAYGFVKPDTIDWYFINNGPFVGYYPDGKIHAQGIVQNHTHGDKWIEYYKTGSIKKIRGYLRDTGWITKFYENGNMSDSIYHAKGAKDLYVKRWFENGQPDHIASIKDGNWNGSMKHYYENGSLKDSSVFDDGKWQGKAIQWYENGNIKDARNYKQGVLNGQFVSYYENGNLETVCNYNNGVLNGDLTEYYEKGGIKKTGHIVDGTPTGIIKEFDENGKLIKEIPAKNMQIK